MSTEKETRWEVIYGVTLAVAAALLGVGDMIGGNADNDQIALINEKASAYQWYQSKSIKETLVEAQGNLLGALVESGAIAPDKAAAAQEQANVLKGKAERYAKEKTEILLGSAAVGKENWVQDVDGTLGIVVGAKEYEAQVEALGNVADQFDMSGLLLQLSLVVGAIGLLLDEVRLKKYAYTGVVVLGLVGACFFVYGLLLLQGT
ncbi:MAG: DUF4337 family protein [Candidatus Hydrogenedentes bacterium]|nr:DUF4337 family protein [Candidatus Hydrogenedentota bacterium]